MDKENVYIEHNGIISVIKKNEIIYSADSHRDLNEGQSGYAE